MCCSRTNNRKINRLHNRFARIIYQEKQPSFEELLEKNYSFFIHHMYLQSVVIEICKIKNGLAPILIRQLLMSNIELKESL